MDYTVSRGIDDLFRLILFFLCDELLVALFCTIQLNIQCLRLYILNLAIYVYTKRLTRLGKYGTFFLKHGVQTMDCLKIASQSHFAQKFQ